MGAAFVRKYNTAATLGGIALRTAGTADIRANPTLASGDVKISKDGGAFANLTTLPSAVPASGKNIEVSLSATELTCSRAIIHFIDQTATKEWDDFEIVVETFGNASAQFPPDYSDANDIQSRLLHTGKSWWVATSGNDANAGNYSSPFLTIGAAITAAASGDTINIRPGTYSEQVSTGAKALRLSGTNASLCTITYTTAFTVTIGSGCTVRGLTCTTTGTVGTPTGLGATDAASDILIEDCVVNGAYDGIIATNCNRITVRRTKSSGTYDAFNLSGAKNFLLDQCTATTDSSFNSGNQDTRAFAGSSTSQGVIRDSVLTATRTGTGSGRTIAFDCDGQIIIENTIVSASASNAAYTRNVIGVNEATGVSTKRIILRDVQIDTSTAGSGTVFDIVNDNPGLVLDAGACYLPTKVSGYQPQPVVSSPPIIHWGIAQAGSTTSITLATDAPATSLIGCEVRTIGGTGNRQVGIITAYNTSTKLATIDSTWTAPANDTIYIVTATRSPRLSTGLLPGVDWANVGNASTSVSLSGTSVGSTSGSGAYSCTWTVNDGSTVLQNAMVRFTEGSSSFIASTDVNGQAVMSLDAATYTVTITKAGYNFSPTSFIVSSSAGTHTHTFSMTAIVVSAAADPAMTNAYLTTYNSAGAITAGIVVTFEPQSGIGADGQSLPMNSFTATSSGTSSNNLTVALQRNRTYRAYRGTTAGRAEIFTTPDASTYQLPEVLGFDG